MEISKPPAIVVIAFNRVESLKRLVESLIKADYLGNDVSLIISIDKGSNNLVELYAETVVWPYGKKSLIVHSERLGLKRHVLACGELTRDHLNICVLEDDLYVSPGFYNYAVQALRVYELDPEVGGISLYSHQWNPYVDRPFHPLDDGNDVYALQIASSWGQIWSRNKWSEFSDWIKNETDESLHSASLPKEVSTWSSKSWLKYHNKYLVERGKYFVYPRVSLTTNFSDVGEHAAGTSAYQVPLLLSSTKKYSLPFKIIDMVRYDAFFENADLSASLGLTAQDVDISLYGNKDPTKRYILSNKIFPFKIARSFSRKFRPFDLNIVLGLEGSDIFLYDCSIPDRKRQYKLRGLAKLYLYEVRSSSRFAMLLSSFFLYADALKRKIFRSK